MFYLKLSGKFPNSIATFIYKLSFHSSTMSLTDVLKSFTRGAALGLALYTCGGEEKEGCQNDYDCREPRVCVRGYCEGGNGGEEGEVEDNQLYTLCRTLCTDYGCAADLELPRNSQCGDACSDLLQNCSRKIINDIYGCLKQSECNDSIWVPCLKSIEGLKDCAFH